MRKFNIQTWVAAATAACALATCARADALLDYHNDQLGFQTDRINFYCQNTDIGSIPFIAEADITDLRQPTPTAFHLRIIWDYDQSVHDVSARATAPTLPVTTATHDRLEVIGQDLLDTLEGLCAFPNDPPSAPPRPSSPTPPTP